MTTTFQKAIEILKRDGLNKDGNYFSSRDRVNGPCCLLGACMRAISSSNFEGTDECRALRVVAKAFMALHPRYSGAGLLIKSIPQWNDAPETTIDDVIALLASMPVPDECVQSADAPSVTIAEAT